MTHSPISILMRNGLFYPDRSKTCLRGLKFCHNRLAFSAQRVVGTGNASKRTGKIAEDDIPEFKQRQPEMYQRHWQKNEE